MTRVEILSTRLNDLQTKKADLDLRRVNIERRKREQKVSVLEKYFTTDLPEGYSINVNSYERVELKYGNTPYDIATAYFYDKWEEDGRIIENAEVSLSSFRSEVSGNEISERFEAIKKFVMVIEDYGDDMIAELNMIESKYQAFDSSFRPYFKDLNKAIKDQTNDIEAIKKENILTKLTTEGIELDTNMRKEKDSYLLSLQLKHNWTMRSVEALKVLRMSTSNKSADIEIKTRDWNGNIHIIKAERIRMENIMSFVRYNQDIIL